MRGSIIRGGIAAAAVVGTQIGAAYVLEPVPNGARAQAVGVSLTTLLMGLAGFVLALVRSHADGLGGLTSTEAQAARHRLALLRQSMAPWSSAPWPDVAATSVALGIFGVLTVFLGTFDSLLPSSVLLEGGLAHGLFPTLMAGVLFVSLGATLGANVGSGTVLSAIVGFFGFALGSAASAEYAPRFSFEPTVIAALTAAGVGLSAVGVGFALAWFRRRLAFVESALVSLMAGYSLYFAVTVGPESWTGGLNVPVEQILLSLSVFPTVALVALMTVGGSLGFLLRGGGRFDPGWYAEAQVALRYLRPKELVFLVAFLGFVVLFPWVPLGLFLLHKLGLKFPGRAWDTLRNRAQDWFVGIVTFIAVTSVFLGVVALIVVLSIMSGFEDDLKKKILGAHAHIVINKHGDDFTEYAAVEDQVEGAKRITSATPFVLGDAMISTDVGLSGTLVKGIDVTDEDGVAELERSISRGKLSYLDTPEEIPGARPRVTFPPPPVKTSSTGKAKPYEWTAPAIRDNVVKKRVLPGIIIGRELSRSLRAYVGDTVKLVSPASEEIGPLGPTPKLGRFRVAGVFYSGMYEYDAKFSYIRLKEAQRFFGMRKRATGVEIKVKDVDETARISDELKRRIGGEPYTLKDWRTMNKELFSALLLEKIAMFVALGMIVAVASFLIVAVLVMIVLQRKKEIAVLKSVGASDASIMKIFVILGLVLGVGGALFGGATGIGICLFVAKFGVGLDPHYFYIERLPVVMDWTEITIIMISAVIISYLATIYPAMTAAMHPPVEGLRDD